MRQKQSLVVVDHPSPNFNERKGHPVQFLVLHYTAMATAQAAIDHLCDPTTQVSSHYVIDEQGTVYRLVAEDKRAWHAGVSYWQGAVDLNTTSIGIEIANPGDVPYTKPQMDAVISLSQDIVNRYKIQPLCVVAHSDIAPDRKQDPGALFDWRGLAQNKLGLWPAPASVDYNKSQAWQDADLLSALNQLGYDAKLTLVDLVTAFQRHFRPEVFQTNIGVGVADSETKARLANLLRRKNISAGMRKNKNR